MHSELQGFLVSLTFDMIIFIGSLVVFCILRFHRGDPEKALRAPLLSPQSSIMNPPDEPTGSQTFHSLHTISYFSWFPQVLILNDQLFRSSDVQLYLYFLWTCFILWLILSFVNLSAVLPIYLTAKSDSETNFFARSTAQNARSGSWIVWVTYSTAWLGCLLAYLFIYFYRRRLKNPDLPIRRTFLPEMFSVLVTGIDKDIVDSSVVEKRFRTIYPESVVAVYIAVDLSQLRRTVGNKIRTYESLQLAIEEQLDLRHLRERRKTTGDKPEGAEPKLAKGAGKAFVSFSSSECALECLRTHPTIQYNDSTWKVRQAPPPQDVVWENIHISTQMRITRIVVLNLLLVFLSVVVITPTGLISLVDLLLIDSEAPAAPSGIFWITFTSWLPSIIIAAVNSFLLPFIISYVADWSGFWRKSSAASYSFCANVLLLLLNTIIIPLTTLNSIRAVWNAFQATTFQNWATDLGKLLLGHSTAFAVIYLMNCTFLAFCHLLQFHRLICPKIFNTKENTFNFGYGYAFDISIYTLVMLLFPTVPLVLPWGALYFAVTYFINKYNFTYGIYYVDIASDGKLPSAVTRHMIIAVSITQLAMSGFCFIQSRSSIRLAGVPFFLMCIVGIGTAIRVKAPSFIHMQKGTSKPKDIEKLKTAYRPLIDETYPSL